MNRRFALIIPAVCRAAGVSLSEEEVETEKPFPPKVGHHGGPREVDVRWIACYLTPVEAAEAGKGEEISFTDTIGKKIRYSITGDSYERPEVEAGLVPRKSAR